MRKLELDEQYEMQQYLCAINVVSCTPQNEGDKSIKRMLLDDDGRTSTAKDKDFIPSVAVEAPVVGMADEAVKGSQCPVHVIGQPVVVLKRLEDLLVQRAKNKKCGENPSDKGLSPEDSTSLRYLQRLLKKKQHSHLKKKIKVENGVKGNSKTKLGATKTHEDGGNEKVHAATISNSDVVVPTPVSESPTEDENCTVTPATVESETNASKHSSPFKEGLAGVSNFDCSDIVSTDNELGILIAEVRGQAADVFNLSDNSARQEEELSQETKAEEIDKQCLEGKVSETGDEVDKGPSIAVKSPGEPIEKVLEEKPVKASLAPPNGDEPKSKIAVEKKSPRSGKGKNKKNDKKRRTSSSSSPSQLELVRKDFSPIEEKVFTAKRSLSSGKQPDSTKYDKRILEPLFQLLTHVEKITNDIKVDTKSPPRAKQGSKKNEKKLNLQDLKKESSDVCLNDESSNDGELVIDTTRTDCESSLRSDSPPRLKKQTSPNKKSRQKSGGSVASHLTSMPCLKAIKEEPKKQNEKDAIDRKDVNVFSVKKNDGKIMNACKSGNDRVTVNSPWKLHKLDLGENLKERAKAFGIAKMVPSKMSNSCSNDLKRKRSSSPECPALVNPSSLGSHQAPKKFFKSKHNANMESMKERQQQFDLKTNASSVSESGVKVKDFSKSQHVGNDAKIVDKGKSERSQSSTARVERRRSSFELIEELKQNLSKNNVEIFPATRGSSNDWPPIQDPRRRNSAEDRPVSKGEASASASGRRLSANECGTRSVATESIHRKKEKKDRHGQRPKKQGYLSQKARSQCEELHRMSRALAVVPRKPIVNQGVERFSNVNRENIDFTRSREMTGSNSNGHCSIDHRRIDTENDIKSASERNGQPTSVADGNDKNVSSKEARNADVSNLRGNPPMLPSPQQLPVPAPSAPAKKKSKEKKRNKEIMTSSNSAERRTSSSDQKKMHRKSSPPSRSKLSPTATEAVVTKKTSEHVSSLHEVDDGTASAKNKEPDHRHPASQHDDTGRGNVNAVKNALIAIHEEAQEKRLAQELPGYNWLEEKLKNGGLSSGGNQYNSTSKRPYNKKAAVNGNSSVTENGTQSSPPASHVAGRGKQKHLTDVEKVEDYAPNTSNGSTTLSINTSLSRKSDVPNSDSSTENNNCTLINPTPDAKQIHQRISNESVTTQYQVVVQSQSECSKSKQLPQSEPHNSTSSRQQQDQASHQHQQYSRQELGQHPNKVMQISQQLSPNCSVPINSAGGPHHIVPAVTYVSPLPPHAMVFPSCPNMQMQPVMATDSSVGIFVPVSVRPPLIASQAVPENSDISQRLCERIKKSQPINSIPAVVSMPQIVSNTAVFANSSSVNTTGPAATSTPTVNNLDNSKQDSSLVQGRMPEPINKPVVTEQNVKNLTSLTTKTSSENNMQTSSRQDKNSSPSFSISQEKQCYRIERPDMVSCQPEVISFQTSSPSFCPVSTAEMNTKLSKDVVENQACMQQKSLKNQTSFEEKSGSDCKNSPKKAYDHEQINMKLNVSSSFPSGNAHMNCESNKQQVSVTPRNSDFSQASERVGNPTENAQYSYFAVKTSDQNTTVGSATSMDVKVNSATQWVTEDWINRNRVVHDKEIHNLDRNVKAHVQNTNNIIFNSVQSCVNATPMDKNHPYPPRETKTSQLESSEDIICIKEVSRKIPHSSEMIKSIDKGKQICSPHMNSTVSSLQCNERNTENMEHNQHVAQKEKAFNASNWGLPKMQSNKQVNEVEPFCSYEKRMTAKVAGKTEANGKADLSKHLPLATNPEIDSNVTSGEKVNDLKDDVLVGEHSKSPFEEELERRKRELEFLEWLARVREQEREKLMQLKREKEKMLKMMEVNSQMYTQTIVKNSTSNVSALLVDPIRKRPSGDSPSKIPEKRAVTESVTVVSTCSTSAIPSHQPPPYTSLAQTGTQVLSHTSHKQPISNPNFTYVQNIPNQHARMPMYPNLSTYPINSAQINYTNYAQGMIDTTRPQQSKTESLRNMLPQQVNVGHMNNMQCNYPISSQANVPCSTCNTIIGNEHRTGGCLIHKSTEKINTSSTNSLSHYPYPSEIQHGNKARGATEQVMPANSNSFVPNMKNNSAQWTKNPQESQANLNQLSSNYPQSKMASESKVVHPMPLPPRLPVRPMPAEASISPRINPSSNNNVILSNNSQANHGNWMNRTSPIQQNMISKLSSGKHEPVYPQPQRLPLHNHHLNQQAQINPVMPNTSRPQINQIMPNSSQPQINPVMPNTSHVPNHLLPMHNNGRMPQIPIPTYRFQPPNISDGKPQGQQMWHPPNPNNSFLQQPFPKNSPVTPSQQQPMAHPMTIVCYNCQGPAQFMCSDCQQVRYCSVNCQTKDWIRHSHQCRNFSRKTMMVPPHC